MAKDLTSEKHLIGSDLLLDSESFLRDLSEEDESAITGGRRSRSNSGPRRRRRRPRRRRRVIRNRSVSRT